MTSTSNADERLIVTIDLGNGSKDTISIRDGDSPAELALAFCLKHNLNRNIQPSIEAYLLQNMQCETVSTEHTQAVPDKPHPGRRLYHEGVSRMRLREQQIQQELQVKAQQELAGHTFKPKINKGLPKTNKPVGVVARDTKRPSQPGASLLKGCTFSPNICANSKKLASSNEKSAKNVYERLYTARPTDNSSVE